VTRSRLVCRYRYFRREWCPNFRGSPRSVSWAIILEQFSTSLEMLVTAYKCTLRHAPEYRNLHHYFLKIANLTPEKLFPSFTSDLI